MAIFDERWKILKRRLIIRAPQLLSLVAKTWQGAYLSHKESVQQQKYEIRETFKITLFFGFRLFLTWIIIHIVWRTMDQGIIFHRVETQVMLYLIQLLIYTECRVNILKIVVIEKLNINKYRNIWWTVSFLKISLNIPAPQLLRLVAKTGRGA